jgi:hypothetical protein
MKLVVAPTSDEQGGHRTLRNLFTNAPDLGGVFYDYLRDSSGAVVGVRYYLMRSINFESHPIYRQFLNDNRFVFRANEFVDIVSEASHSDALHRGSLSLDVVQDFDGVQVLRDQDKFTLVFDLQFDSPQLS